MAHVPPAPANSLAGACCSDHGNWVRFMRNVDLLCALHDHMELVMLKRTGDPSETMIPGRISIPNMMPMTAGGKRNP